MTFDFSSWREHFEAVAQPLLASELRGRALRVLHTSEIPGWDEQLTFGCYSPAFAFLFARELGVRPGDVCPVTVVMNDNALASVANVYADCGLTDTARMFERRFYGIAIHELAHFLDHDPEPVEFPDRSHYPPAAQRFCEDCRDDEVKRSATPALTATLPRPWDMHGLRFVRAACHLIDRFRGHLPYSGCGVVDGKHYGLSHIGRYLAALRSELKQHRSEPITTVLKSDPPKAFADLFKADTAKWEARNADKIKADPAIMAE